MAKFIRLESLQTRGSTGYYHVQYEGTRQIVEKYNMAYELLEQMYFVTDLFSAQKKFPAGAFTLIKEDSEKGCFLTDLGKFFDEGIGCISLYYKANVDGTYYVIDTSAVMDLDAQGIHVLITLYRYVDGKWTSYTEEGGEMGVDSGNLPSVLRRKEIASNLLIGIQQ